MLSGIALLGAVTAGLASWLIDRVAAVNETSQAATRADITLLTEEIQALRAEVSAFRAATSTQRTDTGEDPITETSTMSVTRQRTPASRPTKL